MEWARWPWRWLGKGRTGWRELQVEADWRVLRHPVTDKVMLKFNPETGEVAVKEGDWVYVGVVPEFRRQTGGLVGRPGC